MKKDFIIYTKMLEIVLWLFEKVNTFPKKQRFVLGQQIENSALNCLKFIIEANNAGVAQNHAGLKSLDELNVELEVLRSLLRVGYELHFYKADSLAYIIKQIDEVGKMRGGWAKHYSLSNKDN
jgi:four helix bundle protein